jgi:SAM-dependent methyltransferase
MTTEIEKTEIFLKAFHAQKPGCTPRSMAEGKTSRGCSSYEEILDELKTARISGPILDLACGDGFLLSLAKNRGWKPEKLFGLDLSEGELALAKKNPNLSDVSLQLGNARALPFPDAHFEAVICHMAFMLMPEVHEIVRELHRVGIRRLVAVKGS